LNLKADKTLFDFAKLQQIDVTRMD